MLETRNDGGKYPLQHPGEKLCFRNPKNNTPSQIFALFCSEDSVVCVAAAAWVGVASVPVVHQCPMLPNELLGNLEVVKLQLQSSSDGILQLFPGRAKWIENMERFQWQGKGAGNMYQYYQYVPCMVHGWVIWARHEDLPKNMWIMWTMWTV